MMDMLAYGKRSATMLLLDRFAHKAQGKSTYRAQITGQSGHWSPPPREFGNTKVYEKTLHTPGRDRAESLLACNSNEAPDCQVA